MATKQFGKLKLHASKRGVAFKWGDGDIHRLSFERKNDTGDGYDQSGYNQSGYDQPGYDRQGYEPRYDGQDDYYEKPQHSGGKYDFLYANDWLMYALLVIFPPLGIWILWKRERFTPMIRGILSALSALWFILLLIWLFTALLGGGKDPTVAGTNGVPAGIPANTSSIGVTATPTPTPASGPNDVVVPGAPQGTPRVGTGGSTGGSTGGDADADADDGTSTIASNYCYSVGTDMYYHAAQSCPDIKPNAVRTTIEVAKGRNQSACPTCYTGASTDGTSTAPGTSGNYWMTDSGKYYHKDKTCSDMRNPQSVTRKFAQGKGKKPCPVCIGSVWCTKDGSYYHKTSTCSGMSGAKFVTIKEAKAQKKTACPVCKENAQKASGTSGSGTKYYSTTSGKYYHANKTCSGMTGATAVTAAIAKTRKQTACPKCVGQTTTAASKQYYATASGTYYHTKSDCSGMKNATKLSLVTAKKYGKKACPVCASTAGTASKAANSSGAYYATSAGNYYHKTATCSGMTGAKKITRATAVKNGKKACPVCLQAQSVSVYATSSGTYYHKTATCSGMTGAKRGSLAAAKAGGKKACPVCYKAAAAKTATYYATAAGKYYHKTATCSGMTNASKLSLATAKAKGKTACPTCLAPMTYYYATKQGEHFHAKSNCSGMTGASKITMAAAKSAGKTACPVCLKKITGKPTPTAKKVYCYASSGSKYYHKEKACSGLKNLKKVVLKAAKNRGKTACPVCVTKTIKKSNRTVNFADKQTICYASNASAYFHANKNCISGLTKTTVSAAKSRNKTACPSCASNLNTYVYVTRSGARYHRKSACSGTINAYKISLNTAIRNNYVRCTKCNAPKA